MNNGHDSLNPLNLDAAADGNGEHDSVITNGHNDDSFSDTASVLTEVDPADIPRYFSQRDGRLFHSHGECFPRPSVVAGYMRLADKVH
jgi:hypothetical protein